MIGKTISHYKILEKLGEGGMGVVYKAEDTDLQRNVALKFLAPQSLGSEEEVARFVHEARSAAALDHPNICTVYEIGRAEDQTFIAMAFIEGQSLKDKIEAGPMRLGEAVDLAIQIAAGLSQIGFRLRLGHLPLSFRDTGELQLGKADFIPRLGKLFFVSEPEKLEILFCLDPFRLGLGQQRLGAAELVLERAGIELDQQIPFLDRCALRRQEKNLGLATGNG